MLWWRTHYELVQRKIIVVSTWLVMTIFRKRRMMTKTAKHILNVSKVLKKERCPQLIVEWTTVVGV